MIIYGWKYHSDSDNFLSRSKISYPLRSNIRTDGKSKKVTKYNACLNIIQNLIIWLNCYFTSCHLLNVKIIDYTI